jgi:glycosyltransferase involved in cell wall biosynthesis
VLFANTDWYLYNFRRSLALALRDAGHEVILLTPPGGYGERLRELGFRWQPAPMERRSLNPLREALLLEWLRRFAARERPDLIHGFTIKCAVYGSLAARLAGVPARVSAVAGMGYVFTSNDVRARLLRPVVRALMRVALDGDRARLILQNSDDVAFFQAAGLVESCRVRLIPGSGVDCERFSPPKPARVPAAPRSRFRIVLPARLLWDKGIAEYIEASRLLRAEGLPIEFLLAGKPDPGNPAAVPPSLLDQWVREGVVEWLGHVDDMATLLGSVDAVVLPSYREGLPKGLIEAAACGLPLVTTDVPGCREVVTHEEDGLIVPVKNANALAAAVRRLQAHPELCVRLGSAARRKALTRFDERIVVTSTISVYKELLGAV